MFHAHRWQTLLVTSWDHPGLKFWSQKWLGRKVSCKINKSYPSGVTDFIQSGINGLMISIANTCSHFAALPALAFIFTTFYMGVKVIDCLQYNFAQLLCTSAHSCWHCALQLMFHICEASSSQGWWSWRSCIQFLLTFRTHLRKLFFLFLFLFICCICSRHITHLRGY